MTTKTTKKTKKRSNKGMIYHSSPLRGAREISDFENALFMYSNRNANAAKNYERNYLLFMIGINTGLRMRDIVGLRVCDVTADVNRIRETKTGKIRMLVFAAPMKHLINQYVSKHHLMADDYLFESRQRNKNGEYQHITVETVYRLFKAVGRMLNRDDITAHSLRRTYGYNFFQKYHDIRTLCDIFNHQSPDTTLRYIGITDEYRQHIMTDFTLGFHRQ